MRLFCAIPGLEHNWIELDEVWTRKDQTDVEAANGDQIFDILRKRATACHIVDIDGAVIDDPDDLTPGALAKIDVRLDQFLATCIQAQIVRQRRIANFSARPLSMPSAPGTVTPPNQ